MKCYRLLLSALCLGAIMAQSVYAQTLYNGVGHIPTTYQERWNRAGLLRDMSSVEPKLVINVASLTGTDDQKVQAALTSARNHVSNTGGLAIIYFPTGTYYLSSTITLAPNDSNFVFQGAGSDRTILEFQNMKDLHCFNITGNAPLFSSQSDLDQNFNKGDSIIHSSSSGGLSGLSSGDWIHFVKYNFDYQPSGDIEEAIVGQITRIEAKGTDATGEWAEIKDVANMTYIDSSNPDSSLKVRKITPVRNIGIENLKIIRSGGGKAANVYNIYFNFAINCWVRGVESYKPSGSHLSANRSSHIEISGNYFHEAEDYGDGGHGYGVVLYASTTNSLVENNIFRKLRHALVAGGGSNCNVWTFNYSREQYSTGYLGIPYGDRDLDLHAKYPFGHLFEHNIVDRIESDDHHGDNGPYNTLVRNMATKNIAILKTMEQWSTLGNQQDIDNSIYPLRHDWDYPPVIDIYCFTDNYTIGRSHNLAYFTPPYRFGYLDDISYYYSSKPIFLEGYTWPAIGPETTTSGALSLSIPAYDRYFSSSVKTYNPNPTPHSYYLSGTITDNLTLQDNVFITDDVTVPARYTLTLLPGTVARFYDNTTLYINGTLIAEGTPENHIVFTSNNASPASGDWGAIRFNDTSVDSDCIIKYADIEYSTYGVYCYRANPTIEYSTFSNNDYAIYLYYASPSIKNNRIQDTFYANESDPYLYNNIISGSSSDNYSLWLYQSSPQLFNNTIEGGYISARVYYYSAPEFGSPTDETGGYNRIDQNGEGEWALMAENHASPFLGSTYICSYRRGGNNTVVGDQGSTLALVHASNYSTVDAEYTWWGEYPAPSDIIYADGTSSVNYANALTSDPGAGSSLAKVSALSNEHVQQEQWPAPLDTTSLESLWSWADHYRNADSTEKAIEMYKMLIRKFSYMPQAHLALARVVAFSKMRNASELISYLTSLSLKPEIHDTLRVASRDILVGLYNRMKNHQQAIQTAEQVIRQFPETVYEYTALFNLFNIYQKDLADRENARRILEALKSKYPEEELTLIARFDMGEVDKNKLGKRFNLRMNKQIKLTGRAKSYSLGANYPNPFNPSTVIPFSIPEKTHVKLVIYDILGREVMVLVDSELTPGYRHIIWNGKDRYGNAVSNGVYIYSLQTERFQQSRKLVIIR